MRFYHGESGLSDAVLQELNYDGEFSLQKDNGSYVFLMSKIVKSGTKEAMGDYNVSLVETEP